MKKDLISIKDLSVSEIREIFSLTEGLKRNAAKYSHNGLSGGLLSGIGFVEAINEAALVELAADGPVQSSRINFFSCRTVLGRA